MLRWFESRIDPFERKLLRPPERPWAFYWHFVRPVWQGAEFVPRTMMNLSSSFDHRVIDGYVAARFVQRIKGLLEAPATIFIES